MENLELLRTIANVTDVLMVVTILTTGWVLLWAQNSQSNVTSTAISVVLLISLVWGALWTWHLPLAQMRLDAPPRGQAGAVIVLIVSLLSLLGLSAFRRYFKHADFTRLIFLGAWRFVYGAILLVIGSYGGLPATFYVSAGMGDIFIGLWAFGLMMRRVSVKQTELVAWNALGVIDLLHVLVLAAIHLRPFFILHSDVPTLNLLPLVGVPLFIALHVFSLWGLLSSRSH